MSIDGGLSAPVFWSLEPYEGRPDFFGAIRIPADVFYPVAKRAHELGWQLGIHTMGDGAVKMVAEEMARILDEIPREDHRHYLHHVAVKPPADTMALMAEHGIMVASQPSFTVGLGAYAEEALTAEREATQNPTRSLLDAGVRVSHGSDSAPYGPLITIWTAVTRRGFDGEVHGPAEAVSIEEAIRLHTREPAFFTFEEDEKGAIAEGMLADFIVLSDDLLTVSGGRPFATSGSNEPSSAAGRSSRKGSRRKSGATAPKRGDSAREIPLESLYGFRLDVVDDPHFPGAAPLVAIASDVFAGEAVDPGFGPFLGNFHHPAPDHQCLEGIVRVGRGERHPRIAPDVHVLDPPRRGIHDNEIAFGLSPHRGNLGTAVGHQGGQVDIDPGRQEFLDFGGEGVRFGHS